MSNKLEIHCLVSNNYDPTHIFVVKIERTESVSALQDEIKDKKRPAFDHVPADPLEV